MRRFPCFLFLVGLLYTGCADTTPLYYTSVFNKAKAEQMLRPGKNTIIVKAFTEDLNTGWLHTCAGETSTLMPATERAAEYIKFVFGSVEGGDRFDVSVADVAARIQNSDPDLAQFTVNQDCTSENFAIFNKVADGEFYVLGESHRKIYVRKVEVKGGETKEVVFRGDMINFWDVFF